MKIHRRPFNSIVAHARETYPKECCGILMCSCDDPSTVISALPADNAEPDKPENGYVLGHKVHLEALAMETAGAANIAGYYHSHPDGAARPSRRDAGMAISGVLYVVVAVGEGQAELGAWKFKDDEFVEVPLSVVEEIREQ